MVVVMMVVQEMHQVVVVMMVVMVMMMVTQAVQQLLGKGIATSSGEHKVAERLRPGRGRHTASTGAAAADGGWQIGRPHRQGGSRGCRSGS